MRTLGILGLLAAVSVGGDRIDEIKWLSSKKAFEKTKDQKKAKWVLIYKEWPR